MIRAGDCLHLLRELEDSSVSSIITDPPYGLAFMGKGWLRVAKPGAMLLAFGGTRTYHRLTCSIEDAGFEIRDCLSWLYGSGFPKSLDISKAIDKAAGAEREVVGESARHVGKKTQRLEGMHGTSTFAETPGMGSMVTAPATEAAQLWHGWGTALKPSYEPIVLAMKPLDGTFAANALEHGVAGLNVDGCRVGSEGGTTRGAGPRRPGTTFDVGGSIVQLAAGRWPANLVLDDEAAALLDEQADASRFFYRAKATKHDRTMGGRVDNSHPTVKPTELMRWLVRLVSPPADGLVLDPFAGSGSTGVACALEGVPFLGFELDPENAETARQRIEAALEDLQAAPPPDPTLFD
jgi:site-specific DNA-methyltransferase (adenine-specific)